MNRLILRYGYPITAVILLIFAWVVAQRLARGVEAIIPLAVAAVVVWLLGTFVFVYFWPRITVGGFKRAIVRRGFGGGPIPINTLYAVPDRSSESASSGSLMAVGTDDLVYVGGWLDLGPGRECCMCPRWRDGTTACSSPTRPAAPTLPMSASGPPGPTPVTSSSASGSGLGACQGG